MAIVREHDLHRRRRGRNVALGVVLALLVALVFGLSITKIQQGDLMEGYDHMPRTSVLPLEQGQTLADPGPAPARTAPVAAPGTPAAAMMPAPGAAPGAAPQAAPQASQPQVTQ